MLARLKTFYLLILTYFRRTPPIVVPPAPPIEPPPPPIEPPARPARARKPQYSPDEESGEFYFRESILDQLDYYFVCIARMKRADPEAYALYSTTGAFVTPRSLWARQREVVPTEERLSPWFLQTLPDFGATFEGAFARDAERHPTSKKKTLWPRFWYFRKYKITDIPFDIERVHEGAVYVVTVYWDKPEGGVMKWKGKGRPVDFPVQVMPDGRVRLLRKQGMEHFTINHRIGRRRGKSTTFQRPCWELGNDWAREWALQHKLDIDTYISRLFVNSANTWEYANASVIRVSVNRGDLTAAFTVNIKRTPYFFKDREVTLTESGRKRRIFHIVRPHVRADGAAVRMHFRGERMFTWNGYGVVITVPGIHHEHINEVNMGLIDAPWFEPVPKDKISMEEWGSMVRKHVQEGIELSALLKQRRDDHAG